MEIIRLQEAPMSRWKGGITRELYRDKDDFGLRISCAEIYPGKVPFSDFTGYERILRILEGDVLLDRKTGTIPLGPGQELRFLGNETITSSNTTKILDFNVIYRPELYQVEFADQTGSEKYEPGHALIFAIDRIIVTFQKQWILKKYDYFIVNSSEFDIQGDYLFVRWRPL